VKTVHATFVQVILYHEPDMPQEEAETFATEEFFTLIYGFVNTIYYAHQQQIATEEAKIKKEKQEAAMQNLKEKKQANAAIMKNTGPGMTTINEESLIETKSSPPASPRPRGGSGGSGGGIPRTLSQEKIGGIPRTLSQEKIEKDKGSGILDLVRKKSEKPDTVSSLPSADSQSSQQQPPAKKRGPLGNLVKHMRTGSKATSDLNPGPSISPTTATTIATTTLAPSSLTPSNPSSNDSSRSKKPSPLSLPEQNTSSSSTLSPRSPGTTFSSSSVSPSSSTSSTNSNLPSPVSPTSPNAKKSDPAKKKKKKKIVWQEHRDPDGDTYYYNIKTGESSWQKPPDFPY